MPEALSILEPGAQNMLKLWLKQVGSLFLLLALVGCHDMKPPRPFTVPFDISVAGFVQIIDIEVLDKQVGVGLVLMFHHSNRSQLDYLRAKVCDDALSPTAPLSPANPSAGVVIPIHIRITSGNAVLLDESRQTKGCFSWSASDIGWFDRSIYGRVMPPGKYRIEIRNIQAQPIFQGYKLEIRIPGDRKV